VRAFIAIPLSVDLQMKVESLQREFRHLPIEAAWVKDAGFHITLKFLGEIDPARVASIISCLIEVTKGYQPFSITLTGVGVFPHESHPRVLWVGIQDDGGYLVQLQRTLEASLSKIGFQPEERPFTPHLTLARLKQITRRAEFLACVSRHRETTIGALLVNHLDLLESRLHPSGARYLTVEAVALTKPGRQCSV
jgi:2'-5' RNA ligase